MNTVRVAILTISDTRTEANDESGKRLRECVEKAGFTVVSAAIVRDDEAEATFKKICEASAADVVISTGGTGIAPRDLACEAVEALAEKKMEGFGEAFRRLSWDQIGPRAILSRASAGVYRSCIIVALPGSPKAIALAVDQILAPILVHAVALAKGREHPHG